MIGIDEIHRAINADDRNILIERCAKIAEGAIVVVNPDHYESWEDQACVEENNQVAERIARQIRLLL